MRVIADAKNNHKIWKAELSCIGKGMSNPTNPRSPCGSLLEVNASDIKHSTYCDCEVYKSFYYFVCPVCYNSTELTGKDLKDYLNNT